MKRFSYQTILRQRLVVAGLTLGLLTVIAGVGIELYISTQRTTLPSSTRRLVEPLDPLIDLDTIEALERKQFVSLEDARARVESVVNQGVAPAAEGETPEGEEAVSNPPAETAPEEQPETVVPPPVPAAEAPPAAEEPLPET